MSDTPDGVKNPVVKKTKEAALAKGDETTRVAREIIDRETAARDAKTERLRALRLAKEQEEAVPVAEPAPKKTRKRAATAV